MIHHVEGLLTEKDPGRTVVEVGGVGLEILVSDDTWREVGIVGDTVRLLTHLAVREDQWTLFGFLREEERSLFRLLLGVQGVGPRMALAILSGLSVERLRRAVGEGDVAALTTISGVGKKTAQRMVVDLRDKVGELPGGPDLVPVGAGEPADGDDAVDALVALGYPRAVARDAVRKARGPEAREAPVEEVLKEALRRL